MGMMIETHPNYDLWQIMVETADTGHRGSARNRTYVVASHREKTSVLFDPHDLHRTISSKMRKKVQTKPSDYFLADQLEVHLHAQEVARRRGIKFRPGRSDLTYLLSQKEKERLNSYLFCYQKQYGKDPEKDEDLIVFLSDNPESGWKTWSAASGSIPTMRRNAKTGFLWSPFHRRWMVPREKLAAMAWPVSDAMAAPMFCEPIPLRDVLRASDLCGNAMNFTSVGIAQLIALTCFGPMD